MANGNKTTIVGQPMQEDPHGFSEVPALPGDLLAAGKTLQRSGNKYVTAISVQKPRDLDKIVKAVDREAEYAGDSFYYNWTAGGQRIEGPTIGLANTIAREWGNCSVEPELVENDEAFYITARIIDLETGFHTGRIFRQRKNAVQGKYDPDRKLDMALQIGQSKAIRNVVVNFVPRWLVERAIEKAKEAVTKGIDPTKLDEYKNMVVSYFKGRGVSVEQLIAKAGKPMAEWTTRDIAEFKGDKKALENGEVSLAELFPPVEAKAPEGPITGKAIADALVPDKPPAAPSTEISAEEAKRIREKEIAEAGGTPQTQKAPAPPPSKETKGGKPGGGGLFG